jgi:hypothetical protein
VVPCQLLTIYTEIKPFFRTTLYRRQIEMAAA